MELVRLGAVGYDDAWARQRDLHAQRVAGEIDDTVLLLEHPAVYTAGRRTEAWERPTDGTPVIDVDRGGKITWHGPGQLVGYPIVALPEPIDVVGYVRRLEDVLIAVCASLGAGRRSGSRAAAASWVPADVARAGPQGRGDRRAGRARRHDARLRAQLRLRPGRASTGSCPAASPMPA